MIPRLFVAIWHTSLRRTLTNRNIIVNIFFFCFGFSLMGIRLYKKNDKESKNNNSPEVGKEDEDECRIMRIN